MPNLIKKSWTVSNLQASLGGKKDLNEFWASFGCLLKSRPCENSLADFCTSAFLRA